MRLHRLRLQAFGPFAGTEEIDFDALAAGGLHLIHGPTGAGKTSILDAVCFALFAGVPGGRMHGRTTLRSDHSPVTTRPEVELEFSVGTRRLRVQRWPEHQVAKRRGEGLRTQRAGVVLEELQSTGWTAVSSRQDEAAQHIGDLLGMGLTQFAQVMLLPQGEFAAFLRAKPDERGRLLERLFDISDFAAVEAWLTEHRKTLEAELIRADAARSALLTRARDALGALPAEQDREPSPAAHGGDDHPNAPGDDAPGAGTEARAGELLSADGLAAVCEALSDRLTTALADADATDAAAEAARASFDHHRELAGLQTKAADARRTLAELDLDEAELAEQDRRLDLAARAEVCRPGSRSLERRSKAHQRAAHELADALRSLDRICEWPVPAMPTAEPPAQSPLRTLRERATAGSHALAGQPELDRRLDGLRAELGVATAVRTQSTDVAARRHVELESAEAHLTALEQEREHLTDDSRSHPHWQRLLAGLDAAGRAADTLLGDLTRTRDHTATDHEAARCWAEAEREVLRLRTARLAGVAADLADELVEGAPCPVCGSCEHPRTARAADGHVDTQDVVVAEERLEAASTARARAAARRAASAGGARAACDVLRAGLRHLGSHCPPDAETDDDLRAAWESVRPRIAQDLQELAAVETRLGGEPPSVDSEDLTAVRSVSAWLRTQQAATSAQESRTGRAVQRLRTVRDQLDVARVAHREAELAAAAAAEASRAAAARVDSIQDQLTETTTRRTELLAQHEQVCGCCPTDATQVGASHVASVDGLQRVLHCVERLSGADTELRSAQEELSRQLDDQGFADAAEAAAALLSPQERSQLTAQVSQARSSRLKAEGVLELPDVAAAAKAPPAAVEQSATELAAAERTARRTHDCVGELRRALETLSRIAQQLGAHDATSEPLRLQLAVASALAAAVTGSGDNVMRMRLTAYVLAARLESVTSFANERLSLMTAGRYRLEHSDAHAARGGKSGLGLRVHDAWTGTVRDTATLSGGESFMASLALALGLGDAVLQAAGGRRLETLLVDEGFGSLDEDSLDQVLDVLDDLRAGGRTVGIVSHVAELRNRIPSQIRVDKTAVGSTLQVLAAADVA